MSNKDAILLAALELFAETGYSGTPTSRIAQRAGVSEGLIFRHFGNKTGLLEAILQAGLEQVAATMEPYEEEDLDPRAAIVAHIERSFRLMRAQETFWRLVHQLRFQADIRALFSPQIEAANRFIVERLTGHFQRLEAPQPGLAALLLFAQIDGITMHYLHDAAHYPLDDMQQQLINFYRHGNFLD
jgi:AcrR family transcriptional regulator